MRDWSRSPGCISGESCVHWDVSHRRGRPSKRRARGIAPKAVESRPRSANACWRPSTLARSGGSSRSSTMRDVNDDAPVEVLALDALARIAAETGDIAKAQDLCETADRRMEAASHSITDRDRTDARSVRQIA